MRNSVLTYLLLPLFTSLSFSLAAAPAVSASPEVANIQPRHVEKLNLNTADVAALQSTLTGVGKAKAEAIVAYRSEHGPFSSLDELLEVKGIGQALFERNRNKLTLE
jgi:competence protein ComEA